MYIKSEALVKKSIEDNMTNMIKSIGMKSQDLVQLIREFPEGAESLVIRIISILCESSKYPPYSYIVAHTDRFF